MEEGKDARMSGESGIIGRTIHTGNITDISGINEL